MVFATAVPDVLDMLRTLLEAHPDLPASETVILDGPKVNNSTVQTVIILAWKPGDDRDSVSTTRTVMPGLRPMIREDFEVMVLVNVLNGDGDASAARRRMKEVLGTLAEILTTKDMSLNGTVGNIQLGPSVNWLQIPANGVEISVDCSVTGKAILQ